MGHNPDWGMYIVVYFFLGGIAAGAYFIAALADVLGEESDYQAVRAGYLIAFPLSLVLPVVLILDLGTMSRAFNMFAAFKLSSPMSIGSWALLGFGCVAAISWYLTVFESKIANAAAVRKKIGVIGALFGFYIASYTGVLLGTTNRPMWGGSNLLGALFLASAASTGVAAIVLFLSYRGNLNSRLWSRLRMLDEIVLILEICIFVGFLGVLGESSEVVVFGRFAPSFWVFVLAGLAIPFLMQMGMSFFGSKVASTPSNIKTATVLLLIGGFVLRYLVVMAGGA